MSTPKKLTKAAQLAKEMEANRIDWVETAGRAVEARERMLDRHRAELEALDREIVMAVVDVLDPAKGAYSVPDARKFELPVTPEVRAELRQRKDAQKRADESPTEEAPVPRPALAAVPDMEVDDDQEAERETDN